MDDKRTIEVKALTRVEGEGRLYAKIRDGAVEQVELNIYEPPRYFESLLRGRPLEEAPDITARICGICPVAYQMSACHALEKALGIELTPELRKLRRLFKKHDAVADQIGEFAREAGRRSGRVA